MELKARRQIVLLSLLLLMLLVLVRWHRSTLAPSEVPLPTQRSTAAPLRPGVAADQGLRELLVSPSLAARKPLSNSAVVDLRVRLQAQAVRPRYDDVITSSPTPLARSPTPDGDAFAQKGAGVSAAPSSAASVPGHDVIPEGTQVNQTPSPLTHTTVTTSSRDGELMDYTKADEGGRPSPSPDVIDLKTEWKSGQNSWLWPLPASTNLNCAYKAMLPCPRQSVKGKRTILLLLWTTVQGKRILPPNRSLAKFQCCDGVTWTFTEDKRLLVDADIIEFHMNGEDWQRLRMPELLPHQLISIVTWEAYSFTQSMIDFMAGGVNLLRSYSLRSDLPQLYEKSGGCLLEQVKAPLAVAFGEKDTTPVAALVSNCHTHSGREYVMAGLMENIPVHSFGSCMHNKRGSGDNFAMETWILPRYMFMLAIENRLCRHYITEKWSRCFRVGTIPIIASHHEEFPEYKARSPAPGAYLNVFNYPSVTKAAEHIAMVAHDVHLFMAYHSFRGNGSVLPAFEERYGPESAKDPGGYCALSRKMRDQKQLEKLKNKKVKVTDVSECLKTYKILKNLPF